MLFSLLHAAAIVMMGTLGGRQLDYQVPSQTTWLLPPGMDYEYELHDVHTRRERAHHGDNPAPLADDHRCSALSQSRARALSLRHVHMQ